MLRLPALRRWQKEALVRFESHAASSFLAVATPGAGKTTFALMAARRALLARRGSRVIVVVPTAHLKTQWADAAETCGLHLEPEWRTGAALPGDVHGIVLTYQQAAVAPAAIARVARGAFAILDEVHHAGETRSWGDAIREGLSPAARRLCISGTPFRSDDAAIPFVHYEGDEARPDFEYGYGEALEDRAVVRPVFFPRINGHMEWRARDGSFWSSRFDDPLSAVLASQRLRTALSAKGEWLPAVLALAHARLMNLRERDPSAGGLVIATSQDHAREIARILRERLGVKPVVATSDDPVASSHIARFRDSREPWLVAVRMVSEGVDIPRLRVGVYATTTTTDLFFRQAVGRLVRWVRGAGRQSAYMFIPDDPRIRSYAVDIKRSRRHKLRPPEDREVDPVEEREDDEEREQLDLFSVIAAHAIDSGDAPEHDVELDAWDSDDDIAAEEAWLAEEEADVEIASAVPLPGRHAAHGESGEPASGAATPALAPAPPAQALTTRERRRQLRELNQLKVEALVVTTRLSHAQVNARLNKQVGLRRIAEASEQQLEVRLRNANQWFRSLGGARTG